MDVEPRPRLVACVQELHEFLQNPAKVERQSEAEAGARHADVDPLVPKSGPGGGGRVLFFMAIRLDLWTLTFWETTKSGFSIDNKLSFWQRGQQQPRKGGSVSGPSDFQSFKGLPRKQQAKQNHSFSF